MRPYCNRSYTESSQPCHASHTHAARTRYTGQDKAGEENSGGGEDHTYFDFPCITPVPRTHSSVLRFSDSEYFFVSHVVSHGCLRVFYYCLHMRFCVISYSTTYPESSMKHAILAIFITAASFIPITAQTDQKAGTIDRLSGTEIIVRYANPNRPFVMGDKLRVDVDSDSFTIEVTFPMQTSSKCRLIPFEPGKLAQIKKGMAVYAFKKLTGKDIAPVASDEVYITPAKVTFIMKDARVPKNGLSFPTGIDDKGTAKVDLDFLIAETETTYDLWVEVYNWAKKNGYKFREKGNHGGSGYLNVSVGPKGPKQPATNICWRDAIVWCNALTEYCNMNELSSQPLECVYMDKGEVIRNAKKIKEIMPNLVASGFRLPVNDEWEYAARFRADDQVNSILMNGIYWTKGNSASGAFDTTSNEKATDVVAVHNGVPSTAEVKSRGSNALGIYDMSGNVYEFCFNPVKPGSAKRTMRGGSYYFSSSKMQIGEIFPCSPAYSNYNIGFRLARTKK